MSAPYRSLEQKAESAIREAIIAAATGLSDGDITTSFTSANKGSGQNHVTINSTGGIEDGYNSGNYRLTVEVRVFGKADEDDTRDGAGDIIDTTPAAFQALTGKVMDALYDTALAATLSAAVADFTVFNSIVRRMLPTSVQNRQFACGVALEFSCCPSDIS